MFNFYLASFALFIVLVKSGEGLYCYNCIYVETELPPGLNTTLPSNSSCKSRESLKDDFIVDCDNIRYDEVWAENLFMSNAYQAGVIENGTKLKADLSTDENVNEKNFTCAKFVFNGTFNKHYKSFPFISTIRTCIPRLSPKPFQNLCNNGTLQDVHHARKEREVKAALENYMGILVNTTHTVACTCNEGTCNGSPLSVMVTPFFVTVLLNTLLLFQ